MFIVDIAQAALAFINTVISQPKLLECCLLLTSHTIPYNSLLSNSHTLPYYSLLSNSHLLPKPRLLAVGTDICGKTLIRALLWLLDCRPVWCHTGAPLRLRRRVRRQGGGCNSRCSFQLLCVRELVEEALGGGAVVHDGRARTHTRRVSVKQLYKLAPSDVHVMAVVHGRREGAPEKLLRNNRTMRRVSCKAALSAGKRCHLSA
mmetsp:Transcript_39767/g.118365  ORF Transcript_39767/g.118365 Transcript_39767/m.118365 type:complete len:204 (-) Transcript_39767:212-823(-)